MVTGEVSLAFDAPGYRDGLCALIAKIVERAYVRPDERLQIDFVVHGSLTVSLEPEEYRGAEAVIFTDGQSKHWAVW